MNSIVIQLSVRAWFHVCTTVSCCTYTVWYFHFFCSTMWVNTASHWSTAKSQLLLWPWFFSSVFYESHVTFHMVKSSNFVSSVASECAGIPNFVCVEPCVIEYCVFRYRQQLFRCFATCLYSQGGIPLATGMHQRHFLLDRWELSDINRT